MNFLLTECTFLKYFVPMIVEGNKRGVKSTVFIGSSGKYNCPKAKKNSENIEKLSKAFKFDTDDIDNAKNVTGTYFLIEGCGVDFLNQSSKKICLTYMTDFADVLYDRYIDKVDHVIFPSKAFASAFGKISDKNLYLGSPKYDILRDKLEARKALSLPDTKLALFFYPKLRDISKIDIEKVCDNLRSSGYTVVAKTRQKDPFLNAKIFDFAFVDSVWLPSVSLDLISASDIVINTGSTSIKETTLLRRPSINFCIKPFTPDLIFLQDYEFNIDIQLGESEDVMTGHIKKLEKSDLTLEFDKAIREWLFEPGSSSSKILDYCL